METNEKQSPAYTDFFSSSFFLFDVLYSIEIPFIIDPRESLGLLISDSFYEPAPTCRIYVSRLFIEMVISTSFPNELWTIGSYVFIRSFNNEHIHEWLRWLILRNLTKFWWYPRIY